MKKRESMELVGLAVWAVLEVPIGVTRALALALSTAVLTTTLTTFTPLLFVLSDRRQKRS